MKATFEVEQAGEWLSSFSPEMCSYNSSDSQSLAPHNLESCERIPRYLPSGPLHIRQSTGFAKNTTTLPSEVLYTQATNMLLRSSGPTEPWMVDACSHEISQKRLRLPLSRAWSEIRSDRFVKPGDQHGDFRSRLMRYAVTEQWESVVSQVYIYNTYVSTVECT